ncbi:uncharacterized protein [Venturia canescens]|uniref:uncharacterized protein isoform X2 n=1 Tax=Venturia canescens TaxID=32260 RepID=UPI001C9D24B3|nr:uncharacterized protein LOC122411263 isoform X2 [Venturia canescens]
MSESVCDLNSHSNSHKIIVCTVRRYLELCNEEERYDFNEEGRTDSDDHDIDDTPKAEGHPKIDCWIDTRAPVVIKPWEIKITGPSYRIDEEIGDQAVAGPSGIARTSGVRRLNFEISDSSSESSSISSSEEEISEEERDESDHNIDHDNEADDELERNEWEDNEEQFSDASETSEADSVHQTGGGEEWGDILPPGQRFQILSERARYFRRFKT